MPCDLTTKQQLSIDRYSEAYSDRQETAHNIVYKWLTSGSADYRESESCGYITLFNGFSNLFISASYITSLPATGEPVSFEFTSHVFFARSPNALHTGFAIASSAPLRFLHAFTITPYASFLTSLLCTNWLNYS